jgi:hypothetical protein
LLSQVLSNPSLKKIDRTLGKEAKKKSGAEIPKWPFQRQGGVPLFAKKIRAKLEKNTGIEYAYLLSLIADAPSEMRKKGPMVRAKAG